MWFKNDFYEKLTVKKKLEDIKKKSTHQFMYVKLCNLKENLKSKQKKVYFIEYFA